MPTIKLLVLRTPNLDAAKRFYEAVGFRFVEEQHGTGPVHFAATDDGFVFELYSATGQTDNSRLGFAMSGLDGVVKELSGAGAVIISPAKQTPWGYRAVVRDPDGRAVELYEDVVATG